MNKGRGAKGYFVELHCAFAPEDCWDGAYEYLEVEEQGPFVDVFEVLPDPVIDVSVIAATHLPDAGDAGQNAEAAKLRGVLDLEHVANGEWTGTDERHITHQNIPELR